MDINQALRAAVQRAIKDAHEHRHENNLPEWSENKLAFLFCQHLLSVRGARDWPAKELEPYAVAFWSATRDIDEGAYDDAEFCIQFGDLWDGGKVRHACGNLLEIAKENAKGAKLHPALLRYNSTRIRYLGQVCYELAGLYGKRGDFFLSQKDAGEILGRTRRAAAPVLKAMCADGILRRLSVGSNVTGKASMYVWLPKP